MAECPRCGAEVPEGGICRVCEAARRARGLDLSVLRGPAAPAVPQPSETLVRRRLPARVVVGGGQPQGPSSALPPARRGPGPAPPPPPPEVGGSAEWWRERLRAAGISRTGAAPGARRGAAATRDGGADGRERAARASGVAPSSAAAPATKPDPARPAPTRVVIPAPQAASGARLPVAVAPVPTIGRDRSALSRIWRARHIVPLALGAVLLGAIILIWAPERTTEGELTGSAQAPVVAPEPPATGATQARSPEVGGGAGDATSAPAGGGAGGDGAPPSANEGCGDGGCPLDAGAATQLLDEINQARAGRGEPELARDVDLVTVARAHVEEMVRERRLFHTSNDVLGRRVTNWQLLAESIGVGPSVPSLMDAFLRSEVDRRNLLDPAFLHAGVAAIRQDQRLWVTVMFSDENDPGTTLSD